MSTSCSHCPSSCAHRRKHPPATRQSTVSGATSAATGFDAKRRDESSPRPDSAHTKDTGIQSNLAVIVTVASFVGELSTQPSKRNT